MTADRLFIPQILRRPGIRFVGMESYAKHTVLVFSTPEEDNVTGFIRVKMLVEGKPIYIYQIWDSETNTVCSYEGPHGDPALDEFEIGAT